MRTPAITIVALVVSMTVPAAGEGRPGEPGSAIEARVTSGDPVEYLRAGPEEFGTDEVIYTWVAAEEFQCNLQDRYFHHSHGFWGSAAAAASEIRYRAPLHLPAGALIAGWSVVYEDSNPNDDLGVRLEANYTLSGTRGSTTIGPIFQSSGTPGITSSYIDVSPDHTVWHVFGIQRQSYAFEVELPVASGILFRGIFVHWYRQVSPAPASATFNDVPLGHWAFRHIEALADSGITAGCGGGAYCPDSPLTRAQMAVFLAKALGLHYDH